MSDTKTTPPQGAPALSLDAVIEVVNAVISEERAANSGPLPNGDWGARVARLHRYEAATEVGGNIVATLRRIFG